MEFGDEKEVGAVLFLQRRPHLCYVAASETIHLLDTRKFSDVVESYTFTDEPINCLAVNEKEEYLAACDDDGDVIVVNITQERKAPKKLRGHKNICSSVTFRPKRPWDVLSAGYDQRVMQWDFSKAKILCDINIAEVGVSPDEFDSYIVNPPFIASMSLSLDGRHLACGTASNVIKVFDSSKRTLSYVATLNKHTAGVSCVHFSQFDPAALISGGVDCKCYFWNMNDITEEPLTNGFAHSNGSGDVSEGAQAAVAAAGGIEPQFSIDHGHKINCIATGSTASRNYVVVTDIRSDATVYEYPQEI